MSFLANKETHIHRHTRTHIHRHTRTHIHTHTHTHIHTHTTTESTHTDTTSTLGIFQLQITITQYHNKTGTYLTIHHPHTLHTSEYYTILQCTL